MSTKAHRWPEIGKDTGNMEMLTGGDPKMIHTGVILPYPPSANHYYSRSKKGQYINARGTSYREEVAYLLKRFKPIEGKLIVHLEVFPPDRRKRDLDNLLKCLFDSLQYSGLIEDDFNIDKLYLSRNVVKKNGKLKISVERLEK